MLYLEVEMLDLEPVTINHTWWYIGIVLDIYGPYLNRVAHWERFF